MKKLSALLIAFIIVFSMVSCGNRNEPVNEDAETDVKVEESVEKEDKEEEKADKEDKKEDTKKEEVKKEEEKKPSQEKNEVSETPAAKPEEKPQEKPEVTPQEKPAETKKTAGNILLDDFMNKASGSSALGIAESIASNKIIPFMTGAMPVEPGYLAGFDNVEITGFKEGASFGPMIGSIPFIGYVFILEDGTDSAQFVSNLKSNANLRWNICVEAEEMVAGASGNKVFFVMCNKDLSSEE